VNATEKPHGYLVLDLSQDTNDRLRFRNCIFPEEEPPIFYVDIGNETRKRKFSHPSRTKKRSAKIAKSNYIKLRQRLVNCISEIVLNVLNGNVALTGCVKRKLSKHRLALCRLVDRRVPLQGKKRLIVQRGGFLLPILTAILPTLAALIAAK
jgi:hypothetical protein